MQPAHLVTPFTFSHNYLINHTTFLSSKSRLYSDSVYSYRWEIHSPFPLNSESLFRRGFFPTVDAIVD